MSGEAGYQIWYSEYPNKGFTKIRNYAVDVGKATEDGFSSGKTYYFKIRTYNKTSDGYIYSDFGTVKAVKIK